MLEQNALSIAVRQRVIDPIGQRSLISPATTVLFIYMYNTIVGDVS